VAPSYSVIAAYFPPHQRARALSVFSLGGPIGAAAGYVIGGWVAHAASWRTAFFAIGLFGLALAPIFRLIVKEPVRQLQSSQHAPSSRNAFRLLAGQPVFWLISWGAAIAGVCSSAILFWLPSFMQRSQQMELVSSSQFVGSLVLIAGAVGLVAGGWLSEHFGVRDRGAYIRIPGIAFLVCTPIMAAGFFVSSLTLSFVLIVLALSLTYFYLGPCLATVQDLVPESMKSTAPACMLLIVNLVSLGAGPWLVGAISDIMMPAFGPEALRWALISTFPLYVVGGLMLIAASRIMKKDAITERLVYSVAEG
jgi:MFS family permease